MHRMRHETFPEHRHRLGHDKEEREIADVLQRPLAAKLCTIDVRHIADSIGVIDIARINSEPVLRTVARDHSKVVAAIVCVVDSEELMAWPHSPLTKVKHP